MCAMPTPLAASAASAPSITAEQAAAASVPAPLAGPLNPVTWAERPLFGGALSVWLPLRFSDVSNFRVVPDHQEVWADADSDQSVIIELNSMDADVTDEQAASHYVSDLAAANDALSTDLIGSGIIAQADMPAFGADVHKSFCISSQRISKYHESADRANSVHIYLAVVRLRNVTTDLLISFNVPMQFGQGSSSEGKSIMSSEENVAVIQGVLKTLQVRDWNLFG